MVGLTWLGYVAAATVVTITVSGGGGLFLIYSIATMALVSLLLA